MDDLSYYILNKNIYLILEVYLMFGFRGNCNEGIDDSLLFFFLLLVVLFCNCGMFGGARGSSDNRC